MRTLITLLALTAAVAAQDLSALAERRRAAMVKRYYAHVDSMKDLPAATKAKVLKFQETGLLGGEYGCIHQSLLAIYPEYKRADALLMNERLVAASHALDKLRSSVDPYLKTYATFRYGLALMNRERFEDAEKEFRTVVNELRRYAGCDIEAYFYRIICLGQDRKKEATLAAIEAFEKDVPEAPERYKKAIEQIKNELMQEWESPLYELAGMMNHASREIEKGETGTPTQKEQNEIVAIIEELIRKQEEKEGKGKGNGNGSGPPRGNQPSSNPANRSAAPPGASRTGNLRPKPKRKPGEQWGKMRDKERDEVLQALKEKFPDRYRELLEQYHKALAEGKRVTTPAEDGE